MTSCQIIGNRFNLKSIFLQNTEGCIINANIFTNCFLQLSPTNDTNGKMNIVNGNRFITTNKYIVLAYNQEGLNVVGNTVDGTNAQSGNSFVRVTGSGSKYCNVSDNIVKNVTDVLNKNGVDPSYDATISSDNNISYS